MKSRSASGAVRPRPNRRQVALSIVGSVIGLAGLAFVGLLIARERDAVVDAARDANLGLVALALLIGLASMTWIGLQWGSILRDEGTNASPLLYLSWYFVGQLGKYVPGGIWPVVGRSELAVRCGIPRRVGYKTTTLSLLSTYAAAGLLSVALVGPTEPFPPAVSWALPVIAAAVAFIVLRPGVVRRSGAALSKITGGRLGFESLTPATIIVLVLRHLPAWIGIGTATWLLSHALGLGGDYALFLMATPASWLIGFVIIGVPGGIGVREAVFVALIAATLGDGSAATLALSARVMFALIDVAGAVIATLARTARPRGSLVSETTRGVRAESRGGAPSGS